MSIQNPTHHRQGPREGVVKLDHVRHSDIRKGGLHLPSGDPVVADEEVDVVHILRVVASHHLGEDQVDGVRTVEFQKTRRRTQHRHDVIGPVGTEEDLSLLKHVSDIETLFFKLLIDPRLSLSERVIGVQGRALRLAENHIHVQ